jgi:hypothetical protein
MPLTEQPQVPQSVPPTMLLALVEDIVTWGDLRQWVPQAARWQEQLPTRVILSIMPSLVQLRVLPSSF